MVFIYKSRIRHAQTDNHVYFISCINIKNVLRMNIIELIAFLSQNDVISHLWGAAYREQNLKPTETRSYKPLMPQPVRHPQLE